MRVKKWNRLLLCVLLFAVMLWFLLCPDLVRSAVSGALALCAKNVIPSLFPFFVVSSLLTAMGFGDWLSAPLEGFMSPLFHVSGAGAAPLILGLLGGYPVGARTTAELYQNGALRRDEAVRLLAFTNNSNPAFLISALGVGVFGSVRAGTWLWLIHVLSALLTGVLLCRGRPEKGRQAVRPVTHSDPSFSAALVSSVRGALTAILNVCAFVVLFYVLARPLKALPGFLAPGLTGGLELFSATPMLPATRAGFILAAGLAGWGGLSVLCQTAAVLEDSGLPAARCAVGKAMQGLLSAALAAALAPYVIP